MSGVIEGGWEFVRAAYALTAVVLLGYAASVHRRYRAEREKAPGVAVAAGPGDEASSELKAAADLRERREEKAP